MPVPLWVCGKYLGPGEKEEHGASWAFQGIFEAEALALLACVSDKYFIAPVILNEKLPDESMDWPGLYYPLRDGEKQ